MTFPPTTALLLTRADDGRYASILRSALVVILYLCVHAHAHAHVCVYMHTRTQAIMQTHTAVCARTHIHTLCWMKPISAHSHFPQNAWGRVLTSKAMRVKHFNMINYFCVHSQHLLLYQFIGHCTIHMLNQGNHGVCMCALTDCA